LEATALFPNKNVRFTIGFIDVKVADTSPFLNPTLPSTSKGVVPGGNNGFGGTPSVRGPAISPEFEPMVNPVAGSPENL